jgi:aerobic-type carbon monoxide dehydrogenase small subunit (CoxS/CutS family)
MEPIVFHLNGIETTVTADPEKPLLWVLREELALCGTKFGCGTGACGACTVLVDRKAVRSCHLPVRQVNGKQVVTIEGLAKAITPHIQAAWLEEDVSQCGFCQAGMIMAAAALLLAEPQPDDAAIDRAMTNVCRCGTHVRIRRGIKTAARLLQGGDRP